MKVLTVKSPWAWTIFYAGKDVENRNQKTYYRGPLVIHSSKNCTLQKWMEAQNYVVRNTNGLVLPELKSLKNGYLYGIVDVVGCEYSREGDGAWGMPQQYHWKLSNPRLVVQKPYSGKLGFWEISDEEVNVVSVSATERA